MNGRFPLRSFSPPATPVPGRRVRPRLDTQQAYERAAQATKALLAEYERVMRFFSPSWPSPGALNFENPAADPDRLEALSRELTRAGLAQPGYHLQTLAAQVRAYQAKHLALLAPVLQPSTGGSDAGECDAPVKFPWPSSVDDFKARLHTVFDATDQTVFGCPGFPQVQRDAWNRFFTEWRTFRAKDTPTIGSYDDWVTTCTYAKTLDGWRETINKAKCEIVGPSDIKGYELPTGVESSLDSLATTVKWGVIGLGGIILFATFWPEIRSVLGITRTVTRRK